MNTTRRDILKQGSWLGIGLLATTIARAAETCGLTPQQTEGPFYPVADQVDKDTDLTLVQGHSIRAKGQVITITGQVRGIDCRPIPGAMVEIWQACASGKYNHPSDTNGAALDTDFQYWGRTHTDGNGNYSFRTIKPGAYPADADWVRPPHIHYKVAAKGFQTLTTQLYFAGEALNAGDLILKRLTPAQRAMVTVPFQQTGALLAGKFDIVVGPLGAQGVTPELD